MVFLCYNGFGEFMLEKILNDVELNKMINSINDVIIVENCGDHGMYHALTVMRYVEIILRGIGMNEHDIELGMIAAYLHDTGCIGGKENHALRGAEFSYKYLNNLGMNESDIDVIVHAIKNHTDGKEINNSIDAVLLLADKIHMDKDRMLRYEDNYFQDNVKHILKVDVMANFNDIIINIVTDGDFDYNSFKDYPRMIIKPVEMSKYINKNCVFVIDNKIVDILSIVSYKII